MCVTLVAALTGMPDTDRLDCTRIINVLTLAESVQMLSFEHVTGRQQTETLRVFCYFIVMSNQRV